MTRDELIARAEVYVLCSKSGDEVNLGQVISELIEVADAAERFFSESMPLMNVRDSALDANAIDAWNKAECALAVYRCSALANARQKVDG